MGFTRDSDSSDPDAPRFAEGTQNDAKPKVHASLNVPFGEYLVQVQAITRQQLFQAMTMQDINPKMRLGDCIVTLGILSDREIEVLFQQYRGGPTEPVAYDDDLEAEIEIIAD